MDITSLEHEQQQLRNDLISLIDNLNQENNCKNTFNHSLKNFDFIITHCEVNERQGVGVLVKRIFADSSQIISLRSHDLYKGQQSFGESHYCLSYPNTNHAEILETVSQTVGHKNPKRILCIPYYPDDMLTAIALKDIFKVPLCTYIMDDQNIYVNNISDELTKQLLVKSDLCLGISRDLCQAYEQKYQEKFWFLPPVAPQSLIAQNQTPKVISTHSKKGIIIGNIWSQQWLDKLIKVIAQSDVEIDWYGNPDRNWIDFEEQELSNNGIHFKGYLETETELVMALKQSSFALILTAESNDLSDRIELAKLSLPSRIPFIVATSHTPLVVMGRPDTAAANFVETFKLGKVCSYDLESFEKVIRWIALPENQERLRQNAAELAPKLSSKGIADWIWQSLAQQEPIDLRFENLSLTLNQATVVITLNEVNQQHGTGALVKRIVADTPNVISIRSENHYGGIQDFGEISLYVPNTPLNRLQAYEFIQEHIKGSSLKQILCVPYHTDEIRLAIAVKDLYNVPLATYIMDDQNIVVNKIPDDLMREFLTKCSLRFATHPELRDAYENKYGLKFWLLPAVVPNQYVNTTITFPKIEMQTKAGALLGSIWSQCWFEMLCSTTKSANIKLDWFGNACYWWLKQSSEELTQTTGIKPFGILPEEELAKKLKDYPYIVVPTGTLDERDDYPDLSQLSLPGRIIFALVSSNTPIIILGSEKTGAAHFVKRFGIGLTCDYDAQAFRKAVDHITQPDIQREMRQNAANVAEKFSDKDIKDWLWQSLHNGQPLDRRFEDLLPRIENDQKS